jgi:putative chitinase
MDAQTLSEAMGGSLSLSDYERHTPAFNAAMVAAGVTTALRAAHWCAQIGHESAGLRYMEELADGSAYEGRSDLGNTQPGDGQRFKGSGPIQLTGRANFRAFTRWSQQQGFTDLDFEAQPELVRSDPRWGFLAASWYWTVARPNLNAQCDADDVVAVTRSINGGTNGLADRKERLAHCKELGERLLPGEAPAVPTVEKRLDYSRTEIGQDTYYWCGPATTQTLIQARTGQMVDEATLASELGTTVEGTANVGQLARVLNDRIGGEWQVGAMPNDPPHDDEKEQLWSRIVASINGGVGVAANIWVPPENYPRASYTSTENLHYGGGFVMHYLAVMGYARDTGGVRHVWLADSGFDPHGSWVTFDQFATMIPPREYAWASAWATDTTEGEEDMTPDQERLLEEVHHQLLHEWPQLGNLTLVDAVSRLCDQVFGPGKKPDGTWAYTGWPFLDNQTIVDAVGELLKILADAQAAADAASKKKGLIR